MSEGEEYYEALKIRYEIVEYLKARVKDYSNSKFKDVGLGIRENWKNEKYKELILKIQFTSDIRILKEIHKDIFIDKIFERN